MGLPKKKSMNERNREKKSDADRITQIAQNLYKKQEELIVKHNELAKQIAEMDLKFAGLSQTVGRGFQEIWQNALGGMERMDLNIVAMSELQKEIVGQLLVVDASVDQLKSDVGVVVAHIHELPDERLEELKVEAEATYKKLMAEAFDKARVKIIKDREEAIARFEAEKKAQAEADEKAKVENELKAAAESDKGIQQVSSTGGPGAYIPEGADVFGG